MELVKTLKASKHRIELFDGRVLQFHKPTPLDPKSLSDLLPKDFTGKLEVEIGPGKGEYLAKRAARFPDRFFVGIDRRMDRFRMTEKKLNRIVGKNWIMIKEDARCFISAKLPTLDVLHIYQPDPWPKARHHKHRFFRSPDAKTWASALRLGGEFRLSTDSRDYFEEILDITHSWGFLEPRYVYKKDWHMSEPQTHFESLFMKKHKPVYKAVFTRK